MRKYSCEFCEKELEFSPRVEFTIFMPRNIFFNETVVRDFCPDCYKQIQIYMKRLERKIKSKNVTQKRNGAKNMVKKYTEKSIKNTIQRHSKKKTKKGELKNE